MKRWVRFFVSLIVLMFLVSKEWIIPRVAREPFFAEVSVDTQLVFAKKNTTKIVLMANGA